MAMSKQYSCDLCKKVFNQKIDFTRHQNKKAPCITLSEMQQFSETKDVNMDNKNTLLCVFKNCLNILRDNEGLTGEKALRTLSYLLILKLLEPHFGGEINIDYYEYDFSHIEDEMIEKHKNKLLEIVRFSNLSNEKEDNIPVNMKYLWDDILSNHPTTKNIFLKGKGFDIQHKSTYKKLIDKLNTLDLTQTEYDVLGNAYEEVIQDIMTGKMLGQFFTQPLVKKMMVKLINPQIYPDGKIDTCGDPTMGTGGFLITYLQYILQQATTKNIIPDWDFIKTEGLYGKELEPDTYQLAVSNMLISSGHMFEKLDRGDSIRVPITRKFDNILANPPYGIKGLKYDDFQSPLKSDYVPIKTDNAVSLFIQAIIYMLKINGKCAVVLPDGQDLFSKSNKTLIAVREYLMKTCDLKEIIYLPSGIFTYTSIKTCVFYFVKKREGTDVLETKIKVSKTQKETGRDYKFSKTLQTTKVKFYDYNPYEDVKNVLVEVPIEKIVSNSYSLNYAEYMKDEAEEEQYEDGVVVKTLGEVCEFQNGSQLNKKDMVEGNIPIFGGGFKIVGFHNANNRNGNETIVCGTGAYSGYVNHNYGNPFWASQCFTMKSKNINIMIDKYLYYYSKIILEPQFMSNQKGTAIPFIRYTQVIGVKIPIPSLERQHEIVKYLDFIYEKANKTSSSKIAELKQLNKFCLNNQKIFGENVVKTLGEVCSINYGTRIVRKNNVEGEYPVYGSGRAIFSTQTFNREGFNILIGRFALSLECVRFVNEKIFLNDSGLSVKPKTDIVLHKYIGYYLLHNQNIIYNCARGTAQKNLEIDIFKSIKIPIPSLERQKEIVEYCEFNDTLIKLLEKEIENNKKQAELCINSIVKAQVKECVEAHTESSTIACETNEVIQYTLPIEPKPKNIIRKKIKKTSCYC
jgi:type I restriction-modification system DNA methylase subunit